VEHGCDDGDERDPDHEGEERQVARALARWVGDRQVPEDRGDHDEPEDRHDTPERTSDE
jgi:hypothetical protein